MGVSLINLLLEKKELLATEVEAFFDDDPDKWQKELHGVPVVGMPECIADGSSNKMIARELQIADGTVKLHVKAILRKLGMRSRVEAAVAAVEHGLGKGQRLPG